MRIKNPCDPRTSVCVCVCVRSGAIHNDDTKRPSRTGREDPFHVKKEERDSGREGGNKAASKPQTKSKIDGRAFLDFCDIFPLDGRNVAEWIHTPQQS